MTPANLCHYASSTSVTVSGLRRSLCHQSLCHPRPTFRSTSVAVYRSLTFQCQSRRSIRGSIDPNMKFRLRLKLASRWTLQLFILSARE
ncbi:hypothetical protein IC582_014083 [Cucumis melo]